jgi:hypothetical protein
MWHKGMPWVAPQHGPSSQTELIFRLAVRQFSQFCFIHQRGSKEQASIRILQLAPESTRVLQAGNGAPELTVNSLNVVSGKLTPQKACVEDGASAHGCGRRKVS